jgi:hypothetical protein
MLHVRILVGLALTLMVFSLFVLWVWTGPIGVIVAAALTHGLLRICERQRDAQLALARKAREAEIARAIRR